MSLRLPILTLAFLQVCVTTASASDEHAERIARVETGLRPQTVIQGDPTWTLAERMEHYGVPGVTITVIDGGEIAWTHTWGVADRETGAPVTADTLFQAGSVSKPVAALGALTLVADGALSLDGAVNEQLSTWTIPDNELTERVPVTLTHLLSHTGGLTVHGFPGYAVDAPVPTLVQVLDGTGPANTPAIRVDTEPGTAWRYSGGGYTIAQQLVIDVAGEPFESVLDKRVLAPLGMTRSTFLQPLPAEQLRLAAAGYLPDRSPVRGKRHTYPEQAAAGLWATSDDLARFAIEVQDALRGEGTVIDQALATAMVTPVMQGYGLGFSVEQRGDDVYFSHGGWDEGFCTQLTAHRDDGVGVAVMINSNHPAFISEVQRAVAYEYGWGGYEMQERQPVPDEAAAWVGRYRYNAEQAFEVYTEGDKLFMRYVGSVPEELIHVGDGVYVRRNRSAAVTFTAEEGGTVLHFKLQDGNLQSHASLPDGVRLPRELLLQASYEEGLAAYRALLRADPAEQTVSEGYLNGQGLDLVDRGQHAAALLVLRVATDLYPDSANTWDSLGYAWREAGNDERAVHFYRKALGVDPAFPSAKAALAELEQG